MITRFRLVGRYTALLLLALIMVPTVAYAQDEVSQEMFTVNNTWMLVATFLVFIMHLGFACLEAGLTRIVCASNRFYGSRTTFCGSSIERRCTNSDDFDRVRRLNSGDNVTGIDGALEGIRALYRNDL